MDKFDKALEYAKKGKCFKSEDKTVQAAGKLWYTILTRAYLREALIDALEAKGE